jgi:4-diphosphocytidyl-2-C-methyl-D-erythritol kinase
MTQQSWPAPAKINLFLHITGRRADGYHELQTVFQFLDICDQLRFAIRQDGEIHRISEMAGVDESQDLTVRAARLLKQHAETKLGVDIYIDKVLPMGGGLGGGSSDAATTLLALNHLWNVNLPTSELAKLGLALGADVPVFIYGLAAWAEGVGETFTPVEPNEPWYLVVVPPAHVSTAEIFCDPQLTRNCKSIKIADFLAGQTENVCEVVVKKRYPEVEEALNWLSQFAPTRMTGTGACIFAGFETEEAAQHVFEQLPTGWKGFVAKGMNKSPLWFRMQRIQQTSG